MQEKITTVNADQTGIRLERQQRSERRNMTTEDVMKIIGLIGAIAIRLAALVIGAIKDEMFLSMMIVVCIWMIALVASVV